MTSSNSHYGTPAEGRSSNTQLIERARNGNGNGRGHLIYPPVLESEYDESDLSVLVDASGREEDDLEMWRR